ncbi:hypothetical protein D1872_270370 [compost metagenome]
MGQKRLKHRACHLPEQFVLAARDGQDHRRVPANGLLQRGVGRRIAGVQGYDHIDFAQFVIVRNIPDKKAQIAVLQIFRQHSAMFDDVRFQIESDDIQLSLQFDRQIVI